MASPRPLNVTGAIEDAADEIHEALSDIQTAIETTTSSVSQGVSLTGVTGPLVQGAVQPEGPTPALLPNTVAPLSLNAQGQLRVTIEVDNPWDFMSNPFKGAINYVRCSAGW